MSGKTALFRYLEKRFVNVVGMNETYDKPNIFLPLFINHIKNHGIKYNKFAYGTQLLFIQNRFNRELACKDPSKVYILDRSLYEDRLIFGHFYAQLGLINSEEYNDYKNIFEKLVRAVDPPDCFIFLNTDVKTCWDRVVQRNKSYDHWITFDIMNKLDRLYHEKLKERILLLNPDINLIEIDSGKYQSISEVGQETIKRLEFIYPEFFSEDQAIKDLTGKPQRVAESNNPRMDQNMKIDE